MTVDRRVSRRDWSTARALAAMMLVACLALVPAGAHAQRVAPPAAESDEARALAARNAALEALMALSKGPDFYLVLDTGEQTLRLMLRGAELRTYALLGVQVGLPRVGFVRRSAVRPWQGTVWMAGELDPPREMARRQIAAPPPGADEEPDPIIPPTPEEAYPAPHQYHLEFPGGPALEVRPLDAAEDAGAWSRFAAWWVAYWGNFRDALATPRDERVRLRIALTPEDAGTLYRALPPNVSLLVI